MSFNDALDLMTSICIDVFAEDGDFLYESPGISKTVQAVFDQNHQMVTVRDGAEVSSFHPVVKVHAKDFDQPIQEDDVFTQLSTGKRYLVKDVQPDSGYAILVILHSEE